MEYRTLGHTGVQVSALCLGAMMFGGWGNPDHDDSVAIIDRAVNAGINFIDTADVYSQGESEEIVAKALKHYPREEIVLATKVHGQMGEGKNRAGNSRRWIVAECEESLRRLGTEYIDLYQVHRPDPLTDVAETLSALTDLVHQGKIRYFGSSTFPAHEIVEAQCIAERRSSERFVTEQPPYSILVRGIEADVLPVCERYQMGVLSWGPLAGGWLSGSFGAGKDNSSRRAARIPARYDLTVPENQRKIEIVDQLSGVAEGAGLTLIELAIGFVLAHPAVTSPIIGPRTMDHFEPLLKTGDIKLSSDVLDRIDEIVPPGTNVNRVDGGYSPPSLAEPGLRRR